MYYISVNRRSKNIQAEIRKRKRIIALDIIRGYFLIAIIVDHVPWATSFLFLFSGGGVLFASPAEGFFVISGMLVGYLYGPKILTHTKDVFRKTWRRAASLYVLSITLTVFFTLWALQLPGGKIPLPVWNGSVEMFVAKVLALRYAYGWTDFLPRYVIFMFFAPFMLWLLARGKGWLLAAGSIVVWAVFGRNVHLLPFSAWQLLFVAGVMIGYYLPQIELWFKQWPKNIQKVSSTILVGSAGITYALCLAVLLVLPYYTGLPAQIPKDIQIFFDKHTLGFGRIALGTLWFCALYLLVRRNERRIQRSTLGVVELFGKNSLFTYCSHAVLIFILFMFVDTSQSYSLLFSTLATLLTIGAMYVAISYKAWIGRATEALQNTRMSKIRPGFSKSDSVNT
jgi:hypothetical protein